MQSAVTFGTVSIYIVRLRGKWLVKGVQPYLLKLQLHLQLQKLPIPTPQAIVEREPSSDSEGEESEDLVNNGDNFSSGKDSDSEGEQDIVFNPRDKYDSPFELGMLFHSKDEFRCAVNNHAVKTRRSLKITKNDGRRMHAREYYPKHKCGRSYDVKNVNSKWLSGKYENTFRNDPKRNAKGFGQDVVQEIRCTVTKLKHIGPKERHLRLFKEWFLGLLKADLGIERLDAFTFVSDEHKGPIPAFELVFLGAENRFCVRHLHENFKKAGFRGLAFKLALWNPAKVTALPEYELRMKEMGLLDESTVEWFNNKPPSQWSRSTFQTFPKCDMLLNNLCESFNSSILEAREKPILTMLEWIRKYLMISLTENRDKAKKRWDDWNYELNVCDEAKFTVNLRTHSCSCRRRDLIGIPCSHAMSAIGCQVLEPDDFVHESFSVATYLAVYSHGISPVNGPMLWEKTGYSPPMPPNFRRKKGRPARARRLGANEPRDKGMRGKGRRATIKWDVRGGKQILQQKNASGNDAGPSKRTKAPPQKRRRCVAQKGTISAAKQAVTPEYDNGDLSTPASTQASTAHSRKFSSKGKGQKAAASDARKRTFSEMGMTTAARLSRPIAAPVRTQFRPPSTVMVPAPRPTPVLQPRVNIRCSPPFAPNHPILSQTSVVNSQGGVPVLMKEGKFFVTMKNLSAATNLTSSAATKNWLWKLPRLESPLITVAKGWFWEFISGVKFWRENR
ncbi:hypothetical protein BUALT_BualtUnG0033400 [Buddleja alternifolia]|uniref:SWIM-type domain-containing protein n=1 Tax=Buddleja alternifolia TaxID=168488 RepID=A0AAV6W0U2_9LAMI|nr:hypothetical protein BUALT_BualtUnG0033400 [Buddleja alternifolia]